MAAGAGGEGGGGATQLGGLLAGFVAAPPPAHRLSRIKFADLAGHFAVGGGGGAGGGSGRDGEADYQQQLADSVAQHVHDGRSVGDEFDAHKRGWLLAPWLCWGSMKAPDGGAPATKGGEASAAAAAPEPAPEPMPAPPPPEAATENEPLGALDRFKKRPRPDE